MTRKYIEADEGMIFTDGETYGTIIYLAEGVNKKSFYQVPYEEYEEKLRKEQEADGVLFE